MVDVPLSKQIDAGALDGSELVLVSKLSATVRVSAVTLSAQASDNSFNDSANGFLAAGFAVGDYVNVSGFTGNTANNVFSAKITALTASKMTIGGTDGDVIVDDAAGETVVISKWLSRRISVKENALAFGKTMIKLKTPATSSSAYATKGQQFVPSLDFIAAGVGCKVDAVSGASYRATIFTISGGNVGTIIAQSAIQAPGVTETAKYLYFPFTSTVRLVAGTSYAVVITRTDSTTTYALPIYTASGSSSIAVDYDVYGGSFVISNGARITSTDPTVGQAVDQPSITTTFPFEIGLIGAHAVDPG